jgi:hypothetical protein
MNPAEGGTQGEEEPRVDVPSELPFLVTHWLSQYGSHATDTEQRFDSLERIDNDQRREALERVRRATSELASAFSALGAFGVSSIVSSVIRVSQQRSVHSICTHIVLSLVFPLYGSTINARRARTSSCHL